MFALGQYDEAAGATQAALAMLPEDKWGAVVTHYKELYPNIADYTTQIRALEKARDAKPDAPALHFLLGYHFGYLNYPKHAVRELDKVLAVVPKDKIAQKLRDEFAAKLSDADKAALGKARQASRPTMQKHRPSRTASSDKPADDKDENDKDDEGQTRRQRQTDDATKRRGKRRQPSFPGVRSLNRLLARGRDKPRLLAQHRFAAQQVVVVLGEAMGFVADVLQQPQRIGMPRESQRLVGPRHVNLFFPLGQRNHRRRRDAQLCKRRQTGRKLALAAVDQQDVGKQFRLVVQPLEPPGNHLADAGKVVDSGRLRES